MTDLFHENGHLTDEALVCLIHEDENEPLSELQRLEIAEHLSYCDTCTERYSELLTDLVLVAPPVPLYGSIMKRIKERTVRLLFSRLATVSTAACLAMVFWWVGVFNLPEKMSSKEPDVFPQQTTDSTISKDPSNLWQLRTGMQEWTDSFSQWSNKVLEPFEKIFAKTYEEENLDGKE